MEEDEKLVVGLYVDRPSLLGNPALADALAEAGCTHLIVNVQRSDGRDLCTPSELGDLWSNMLIRLPQTMRWDMYGTALVWPQDGEVDANYLRRIQDLGYTHGFQTIRLDLEANELRENPIEEEQLRLVLSDMTGDVTTHQGHPEVVRHKSKIFRYFGGEVQAYSTSSAVRKWGPGMLPGRCQRSAVEKGLKCSGEVPEVALPLYNQTDITPGMKPEAAMRRALLECLRLKVPQVNYWSAKHLLNPENTYARMFFCYDVPKIIKAHYEGGDPPLEGDVA